MAAKDYSIQIQGRGEEMVYADGEVELHLERTYCNGHRLYCDNTSGVNGPALAFGKRRELILNLCEFFNTKDAPTIFVLDEADKDRHQLEMLFTNLLSQGHKVSVEYDSVEKRDQVFDEMHLSILRAGKKLSINGVEIKSVETTGGGRVRPSRPRLLVRGDPGRARRLCVPASFSFQWHASWTRTFASSPSR